MALYQLMRILYFGHIWNLPLTLLAAKSCQRSGVRSWLYPFLSPYRGGRISFSIDNTLAIDFVGNHALVVLLEVPMWRPSPASGDLRQHREHDIKQKEKDDTITVDTYQNKLNSQSYSRLKMPTMAGRPTLSRLSKSVRMPELEATSNANFRQASQR
jgi:hypothetical protein